MERVCTNKAFQSETDTQS